MTIEEYIKELQKYNPKIQLKKSVPTRDDCVFYEPPMPKIIMIDDWHEGTTKSGYSYSYSYEKKPILVI